MHRNLAWDRGTEHIKQKSQHIQKQDYLDPRQDQICGIQKKHTFNLKFFTHSLKMYFIGHITLYQQKSNTGKGSFINLLLN